MSCISNITNYPYTELFCEGRWGITNEIKGQYLPEWGNSISALFISLIGIIQLYNWNHDSIIIRLCSAMFFVNGWSSFLNHYTGYVWWSLIDGQSMIIVVYLLLGLIIEEICTQNYSEYILNKSLYKICRSILWCLIASIFWLLIYYEIEGCNVTTFKNIFEICFGVPILIIVCLIYIQLYINFNNLKYSTNNNKTAAKYLFIGTIFAIIGTIVWILTESLCDSHVFFRYFPGHIIWHLFMTYGLGNILFYIVFIRTDNYKKNCNIINKNKMFILNIYYKIFPSIEWESY